MAFALTPAKAYDGVLDYTTSEGRKLFSSATKSLYHSEEGFDCTPEDLHGFIEVLADRAQECDWDFTNPAEDWDGQGVLVVAKEDPQVNANPDSWNLLENHGQIELDLLKKQAPLYLGTETRRAQDDMMLYKCLFNSLTDAGRQKILIWKKDYVVNDQANDVTNRPCGILLLKVIIRESHIDTNATTTTIRNKLSNLDEYIATVNQNITKFNAYVQTQITALETRGETTTDLLANLFKGYAACSDKNFVKYIANKEEKYEEGEELNPKKLMLLADTKYKTLVEKGTWDAPSAEEEKIIALQAQVESLQKKMNKAGNSKDTSSKTGKEKGKGTPKKPDWMYQEPPEDKLKEPRNWNGKPWYWCSKKTGGKCTPGAYRRHKPSECKGIAAGSKRKTAGESKDKNTAETNPNKRVRIAKALEAMHIDSDNE